MKDISVKKAMRIRQDLGATHLVILQLAKMDCSMLQPMAEILKKPMRQPKQGIN